MIRGSAIKLLACLNVAKYNFSSQSKGSDAGNDEDDGGDDDGGGVMDAKQIEGETTEKVK